MLVGFIKQIRNDQPAYVYKVAIEFWIHMKLTSSQVNPKFFFSFLLCCFVFCWNKLYKDYRRISCISLKWFSLWVTKGYIATKIAAGEDFIF